MFKLTPLRSGGNQRLDLTLNSKSNFQTAKTLNFGSTFHEPKEYLAPAAPIAGFGPIFKPRGQNYRSMVIMNANKSDGIPKITNGVPDRFIPRTQYNRQELMVLMDKAVKFKTGKINYYDL